MRQYLSGHREPYTSSADATGERLRLQSHRIVAHLEQKVAELSSANERLREIERLRTEFYRNISHELATPLTPIVGYLRMLVDEELGPLNKPQAKAMRAMDDCVRRLRSTLDNLIDVTGLETGRMRFIPPRLRLSRHRAPRAWPRTPTRSPSGSSPCSRRRRAARCRRTATPSAWPARSASSSTTPASSRRKAGTVGVCVRVLEAHYELLVADSGPGVPPERADRVFDPFYQVDGSPDARARRRRRRARDRAAGGARARGRPERRRGRDGRGDVPDGRGVLVHRREARADGGASTRRN